MFVSGEPNGNCRSHAVAKTVSSVVSQSSDWGYHLSWNSLGGLNLIFTLCFLLGLVFKLGISTLFFVSISMPGCMLGPVRGVSRKGGLVWICMIKSTVGCLYA